MEAYTFKKIYNTNKSKHKRTIYIYTYNTIPTHTIVPKIEAE